MTTEAPGRGGEDSRIGVLVVDDSAVIRRIVCDMLATESDITILGTAADGERALAFLAERVPDVVILDIEMPVLDGLATLEKIRERWADLPVVMFSTLTNRGAIATLDALARGATDYVAKPSNTGGADVREAVKEKLVAAVRTCGVIRRRRLQRQAATPPRTSGLLPAPAPAPLLAAPRSTSTVQALCVASSTGGPNALTKVLPALPGDLRVPVLVVQHMPALFTALLAERLDTLCALTVHEGAEGMAVEPGHCYIAPGGKHMTVAQRSGRPVIAIDDGPPENSVKPAADVLLRGATNLWRSGVLAVVLTGMGSDGLVGCRAVRAAGGAVFAQDQASSVVWGMPGAVVKEGLAEVQLPLEGVASAVTARIGHEGRST